MPGTLNPPSQEINELNEYNSNELLTETLSGEGKIYYLLNFSHIKRKEKTLTWLNTRH